SQRLEADAAKNALSRDSVGPISSAYPEGDPSGPGFTIGEKDHASTIVSQELALGSVQELKQGQVVLDYQGQVHDSHGSGSENLRDEQLPLGNLGGIGADRQVQTGLLSVSRRLTLRQGRGGAATDGHPSRAPVRSLASRPGP